MGIIRLRWQNDKTIKQEYGMDLKHIACIPGWCTKTVMIKEGEYCSRTEGCMGGWYNGPVRETKEKAIADMIAVAESMKRLYGLTGEINVVLT